MHSIGLTRMLPIFLALWSAPAHAEPPACPGPDAPPVHIGDTRTRVLSALATADAESGHAVLAEMEAMVHCLRDPVSPADLGSLYQTAAALSYVAGFADTENPDAWKVPARLSFRSAVAMAPQYPFDPELDLTPNSPLRALHAEVQAELAESHRGTFVAEGTLLLDGNLLSTGMRYPAVPGRHLLQYGQQPAMTAQWVTLQAGAEVPVGLPDAVLAEQRTDLLHQLASEAIRKDRKADRNLAFSFAATAVGFYAFAVVQEQSLDEVTADLVSQDALARARFKQATTNGASAIAAGGALAAGAFTFRAVWGRPSTIDAHSEVLCQAERPLLSGPVVDRRCAQPQD